jgi:NitT/TauT family transport system substrate-binding protein
MKRAVRFGIASLAVAAVGGALVAHQTSAQSMTEVSFILNWFVEPPHGGYYAAMKDGLYEKAGLKVKLIPGGPDVAGQTLLAAGKVQFAESDPPAILNARAEGAPLVGVFATFQDSPQAFLYHKSNPVKSFADFKGRTVEVSPGAPYWDFIEAKYKLKDNYKRINYGGQVGPFVQDKTISRSRRWISACCWWPIPASIRTSPSPPQRITSSPTGQRSKRLWPRPRKAGSVT